LVDIFVAMETNLYFFAFWSPWQPKRLKFSFWIQKLKLYIHKNIPAKFGAHNFNSLNFTAIWLLGPFYGTLVLGPFLRCRRRCRRCRRRCRRRRRHNHLSGHISQLAQSSSNFAWGCTSARHNIPKQKFSKSFIFGYHGNSFVCKNTNKNCLANNISLNSARIFKLGIKMWDSMDHLANCSKNLYSIIWLPWKLICLQKCI